MADRVIHFDIEVFLTSHIRQGLNALAGQPFAGGFVSNEFWTSNPQDPRPAPRFQVVVRDDSGPRTSVVTKEPSVGITVLGSDSADKIFIANLGNVVFAIMEGCARSEPGNPVAAVLGANGPYKVTDDSGHPRRYMTFELSVVGKAFP
ncbi:hypothetical protein D3C73_674670 [compost metagenome]